MEVTELELAWASGFFEGEGSIMLVAAKFGRYRLSVEVSQVDPAPPAWFQERWGGQVYGHSSSGPGGRPYTRWVIVGNEAAAFLREIRPYVVRLEVEAKIELALDYQAQKTNTWANRTEAYREVQDQFAHHMRELNRRGLTEIERLVIGATRTE